MTRFSALPHHSCTGPSYRVPSSELLHGETCTCIIGSCRIAEQAWHLVQMRNVTRIVDKMLRNAFNLGYIQLALPRSCVIHTVRHPLDVALSCFSQAV